MDFVRMRGVVRPLLVEFFGFGSVFSPMDGALLLLYRTVKCMGFMAKVRRVSTQSKQNDMLVNSLIGMVCIFVATAIWWSLAPQWLTSTWQTF